MKLIRSVPAAPLMLLAAVAGQFIRSESARWKTAVERIGIRPQ